MNRQRLVAKMERCPRGALIIVVALGLFAAGCGSTSVAPPTSTTSTTPAPVVKLSTTQLAARFQALVNPSDKAFSTFVAKFKQLGPLASNAAMRSAVAPASTAIVHAAQGLSALRPAASDKSISGDLGALVGDYNVVYQGLMALVAGYGSRAFDLGAWATAFQGATNNEQRAATKLNKELGVHLAK